MRLFWPQRLPSNFHKSPPFFETQRQRLRERLGASIRVSQEFCQPREANDADRFRRARGLVAFDRLDGGIKGLDPDQFLAIVQSQALKCFGFSFVVPGCKFSRHATFSSGPSSVLSTLVPA